MSFLESFIGAFLGTVLGSITISVIGFFLIKYLIKRVSQDPEIIKWFRALKRKILDEDEG